MNQILWRTKEQVPWDNSTALVHLEGKKNMKEAALILEGGAVRGVFTAGVLDYLMEKELSFSYVVGVSAGACNAVDYVSWQPGRTRDCMIPKDKEYDFHNHKNMLRRKSLFDMDMIFDIYPNQVYPFDYDTYFQSPTVCEVTVTNCLTGKAEYLSERTDKQRLMQMCRASSSLPLVSPMVYIDGTPYLDGGLSDSVPIRHTITEGHKKNVVILTRNTGYRKSLSKKTKKIYIAAYRKYPELVKAIYYRAEKYNRTMEYIEYLEEKGRIFVLRPSMPAISKLETKEEKLSEFYQHGYDSIKERYNELVEYLERKE